MAFNLHIKNIGKLTDAKLRIGRFTVLAGPNNTGKSFVSKILYSLFDAMNANHVAEQMRRIVEPVWDDLEDLLREALELLEEEKEEECDFDPEQELDLDPFFEVNKIRQMKSQIDQFSPENPGELDRIISDLVKRVKGLRERIPNFSKYFRSESGVATSPGIADEPTVESKIDGVLEALQNTLISMDAKNLTLGGIEHQVKEKLLQNFQVSSLTRLQGIEKYPAEVSIDQIGKFRILNGSVKSRVEETGLQQLRHYSKAIYLESPMHWKSKNALEALRLSGRHWRTRRERLFGVPEYFYDLASDLRSEYTEDMDFPELYAKLTGKNVLGGKLVISDTGEILFREKDRSFRLALTATGVVNLGILALLIERKILDKDSFVFIDEPEAHLHPAWQVVMAETLFELAKEGAHIVVATHSPDILKWLEVHIKKHSEDAKFVALNKFPADTADPEEESFDDKMAAIKQELTKPFADLYMEGL